MNNIRRCLLDILEPTKTAGVGHKIYDGVMTIVIVLSLLPLMSRQDSYMLQIINKATLIVFCTDYLFRLCTADLRMKQGRVSFLRYPLTPLALCDFGAILSYMVLFSPTLRLLKAVRLLRGLKMLRIFKTLRLFESISMILDIIKEQQSALLAVCVLAVGYVFACAMIIFNVEPESFPSFFDAIYWATVSLTTVGYGDIYPISTAGRIITMLSSVFGIAIVALPAGIITAGVLERIKKDK